MNFPRLAAWLFDLLWEHVAAERNPDFIVGADDPEGPYLRRWWLIPRNPVFNVYLHQFLRDDDDRALHDHPWPSCSFILHAGYVEHTIAAGGIHCRELIPEGALRFMRPRHAHRVELIRVTTPDPMQEPDVMRDRIVHPIRAWTLFITGPRIRRWGFHCPQRGWVDFARFTKPGSTGETGAGCDA